MLRPCIIRDCPELTDGTRCAEHQRQHERNRRTEGRTGRRGSTPQWRRMREFVIANYNRKCAECGTSELEGARLEVDHVDGNPENSTVSNLRPLCENCHREKTREQAKRDALVIVCGQAGVGKTTVTQAMEGMVDHATFGFDPARAKWADLFHRIDRTRRPVIECCRLPIGLRLRCRRRGAIIIELQASLTERVSRLRARGEPEQTIREWTQGSDGLGIGYEDSHLKADLTLDTEQRDPVAVAREAAAEIQRVIGDGDEV